MVSFLFEQSADLHPMIWSAEQEDSRAEGPNKDRPDLVTFPDIEPVLFSVGIALSSKVNTVFHILSDLSCLPAVSLALSLVKYTYSARTRRTVSSSRVALTSHPQTFTNADLH